MPQTMNTRIITETQLNSNDEEYPYLMTRDQVSEIYYYCTKILISLLTCSTITCFLLHHLSGDHQILLICPNQVVDTTCKSYLAKLHVVMRSIDY